MSVMSFDKGQNKTGERKRKDIMTQDTHEPNLCLVPTRQWAFRKKTKLLPIPTTRLAHCKNLVTGCREDSTEGHVVCDPLKGLPDSVPSTCTRQPHSHLRLALSRGSLTHLHGPHGHCINIHKPTDTHTEFKNQNYSY